MKDVILSIDLGTMGVKVSFVNLQGVVEASAYREYPVITDEMGMAEQDHSLWWKGVVEATKEARDKASNVRVNAISLCGQMHTHVYLDSTDRPLGMAVTWLDQRSASVIRDWERSGIRERIFDLTWVLPTTTYTLPQLVWTKQNRPEVFKTAKSVLVAKDYVKFLLTGKKVTDPSDASGMGAFDIKSGKWIEEVFNIAGIPLELFPEVLPSTSVIGRLTKEASEKLGLLDGIPVINGGSDHAVAEMGAGMLGEGDAVCILGTAGVIATATSSPIKDRRVVCWRYPVEGLWDILGITQTAASSLSWFRNVFDPEESEDIFQRYSELASEIVEGAEGLVFLPYLMGERTPYWDSKAKGVFFGVKMAHKKPHFVRAIMEGVAFSLKDCVSVMEESGILKGISLIGGGSKSPVWRSILANVLEKSIMVPEVQDASAIGNLMLAGVGLDYISSVQEMRKLVKYRDEVCPEKEVSQKYAQLFDIYRKIYKNTRDIMHLLD